jgi:hypothetical protein
VAAKNTVLMTSTSSVLGLVDASARLPRHPQR